MRAVQFICMGVIFSLLSCTTESSEELQTPAEQALSEKSLSEKGLEIVADNPALGKELAMLKAKLASVRTLADGAAAGWDFDLTGYVPHMGYHFVNWDFINDGVFNMEEPEAVLFACAPSGELESVGVEYLVPIQNLDNPEPAPEGFTGNADEWRIVGPFWTLHAWIKKPNPAGMFNPTNPEIASTDDCSE